MENLFAYGTLMCHAIFEAVTGLRLDHQPVTLAGFMCWSVKGEAYPAIVRDPTGLTEGVVYPNLPASVWQRLDHYEGEMYTRQTVRVQLADGSLLPASTYVWNDGHAALLDRPGWRFSGFMNRWCADYLRQLR